MMKNTLIFYFHGYNSSPNTDKVKRIQNVFPDTFAFFIDPDPSISITHLSEKIESVLLDYKYLHKENLNVVFIGTSLGAWYASNLAEMFNVKSVLINPCYDPHTTLKRLGGVSDEICDKYNPLVFSAKSDIYISIDDEVIDYSPIRNVLDAMNVSYVKNSNHRFNGPEFDAVLERLLS